MPAVHTRTADRRRRAAPLHAVAAVLAAAAVVVVVLTGCVAPAASSVPAVLETPELAPGARPAAPRETPLLTVSGRIATTNADGALRLDRAELDRLGLLEVAVDDPFARQRLVLRGIWLRDLVDLARPDADATTLHLRALDDYEVDLVLADVRSAGVFLATRNGAGAALPAEEGGPTRLVFTDDLATRFSPDLWIWNIDTIDVR